MIYYFLPISGCPAGHENYTIVPPEGVVEVSSEYNEDSLLIIFEFFVRALQGVKYNYRRVT